MSFRLYESAWVNVDGVDKPCQARKDPTNMAAFIVGDYQYDIDARPLAGAGAAPAILSILSLQAMREFGLRSNYNRDVEAPAKSALL
jgi:hypothetical protein